MAGEVPAFEDNLLHLRNLRMKNGGVGVGRNAKPA
jgi:hypothetical protein